MKNGQNGQQDETVPQAVPQPTSTNIGWANTRCATQMNITETVDTLRIQTTLIGLEPDSLIVTIRGPYFVVEGTIAYTGGRGRYARYVAELATVRDDYMDVTYQADGELSIRLLKQSNGSSG